MHSMAIKGMPPLFELEGYRWECNGEMYSLHIPVGLSRHYCFVTRKGTAYEVTLYIAHKYHLHKRWEGMGPLEALCLAEEAVKEAEEAAACPPNRKHT